MLRSVIRLLNVPLTQATQKNVLPLKSNQLASLTLAFNYLHTTSKLRKTDDRQLMLASMPKIDEGTEGEKHIDIDTLNMK